MSAHVEVAAKRIIGIALRTNNAAEMNPATAKIGPHWGRLQGEKVLDRIPARVDGKLLAVYTQYASDHRGEYTLVLGCEVAPGTAAPEGMVAIDAPAARHRRFAVEGQLPAALIRMWGEIWHFYEGGDEQRAYTVDYEVYQPPSQDRAEILIAVK